MDKNNLSLKAILAVIGAGIWVIVLQNAGILPGNQKVNVVNTVDTYVHGGQIDSIVTGNVNVDLKWINGWHAANYKAYTINGQEFHSLGVKQGSN
ncbi:MAG: hypothetical protein WD048_13665 [Chitinophagales bacterium]